MSAPTLLLFAIKSSLRLGQQARTAYVDATRRRELTLPLPNFKPDANVGTAVSYFRARLDRIEGPAQLRGLLDKIKRNDSLDPQEQGWLMDYYNEFLLTDFKTDATPPPATDGSVFSQDALRALVTVRQWQRGADPNPSTLQRLGGTLLEVGVDYFLEVPGGLNLDSCEGRALHALFTGLDRIDFAAGPLGDLPAKLFTATLETLAANPDLLSEDPKVQDLISATTTGLVTDVAARIEEIRNNEGANLDREERVRMWGELVFRSMLSNAGGRVAADPSRYLGVDEGGEAALVGGVGQAVMGLVLEQPVGKLDRAFSRQGLDRVVAAALDAVARHPALVAGDNPRLHKLVTRVATDFSGVDGLVGAAMVPELARILITRTGENLELLWPEGQVDPRMNLALVAAKSALKAIAAPPEEGDRWRPTFGREAALGVVEAVLDQLAQQPGWLVDSAGEVSPHLADAVGAMVQVLRTRGDPRLTPAFAAELLEAGIGAAALRAEFLAVLPNRGPLIAAVLDAVLGTVLDPQLDERAAWRLVKQETLRGLLDVAIAELERTELKPSLVAVVEKSLTDQVAAISAGKPWSLETFAEDLKQRFAA